MNKSELVETVAKDAGISKALAGKVLDSAIDAITKNLGKGDRVALVGFGTFSVGTRKARTGRNPQTGQPIQIRASKVVRFRPGRSIVRATHGPPNGPDMPPPKALKR